MRVFLTGGTGFIGQALVRAMRARAWEVRALVRDLKSPAARWLLAQGATLVAGDVTQRDGLARAMAGSDAVVHNAGLYELGADAALRERMRRVNVEGTDAVLEGAREAGVARTVYVSTVWALGASGPASEPATSRDEAQRHGPHFFTEYERTKAAAHEVALAHRDRGLPLVVVMPNAVIGANDHSTFGYFLRLYLLGAMPPLAWGAQTVYSLVDVEALAEGICLATERAAIGEDYVFCGEPLTLREIFAQWARFPGGAKRRVWLPLWLMRPQMALFEPILRALGLPAFFSRETVDVTNGHLCYSSAKARRDLGWEHPTNEEMWAKVVARERALMGGRRNLLARLRHQPAIADGSTASIPMR